MGINSKIERFKSALVADINGSELPASVVDLIMSNMLSEIRLAAKQQLAQEISAENKEGKEHE